MSSRAVKRYLSFCIVSFWIAFLGGSPQAHAQCSDDSTLHIAIDSLTRTGGNTVTYDVGTETTGDYAEYWQNYVDFSESSPSSTVMHSNSGTWSSVGQEVYSSYNDHPSVYGAGNYSATSDHNAYASCYGYSVYPGNPVDLTLTVTQPSVSGILAAWYLGSGVYDATNGYYNQALETANTNCGPDDSCTETPSWTIVTGSDKVSLSPSSGASTTLTALAGSATLWDVSITFSLDGFTSSTFYFDVGTPVSLASGGSDLDLTDGDGYFSYVYYSIQDNFGDSMSSIALNEAFSGGWSPDVTNNWPKPSAGGLSTFSGTTWADQIYIFSCSGCSPPTSNPQSPLSPDMVDHSDQSWQIGSSTVGTGIEVQTDTLQRFIDHGAHEDIVSPVP